MSAKSSGEQFRVIGKDLTITFENQQAADHFKSWLCGAGEQDYWMWMEYREKEEQGPITATSFEYHEPGGSTIVATCGRMDEQD